MFRAVKPEDAATVLLLRESGPGLEVYLTLRREELMFLGGYHVFPGGKVDEADHSERLFARCRGLASGRSRIGGVEDGKRALGFLAAAARELFEEAGVLLAEDEEGRALERPGPELSRRLDFHRIELQQDRVDLAGVLEAENLFLSLSRLYWFAHWVTPASSPRRFNTFFFVARTPEDQRPLPFPAEVSEGQWVRPEQAIEKWRQGKWRMIPPTISSLDTVSRYRSWAELKRDFSRRPEEQARTVFTGSF